MGEQRPLGDTRRPRGVKDHRHVAPRHRLGFQQCFIDSQKHMAWVRPDFYPHRTDDFSEGGWSRSVLPTVDSEELEN